MSSEVSLGRLNAKLATYKRFALVCDNPLMPVKFSVLATDMTICVSAFPYISFRIAGEPGSWICLNHIKSIKSVGNYDDMDSFKINCADYLSDNKGDMTTFSLVCYKT